MTIKKTLNCGLRLPDLKNPYPNCHYVFFNLSDPPPPREDNRIYLATVSQGGKDGYSIASGKLIAELKKIDILAQTHYDNQKVAILFHNPYSIARIESPYRIIMTMFESDKIPDDWKGYLEMADKEKRDSVGFLFNLASNSKEYAAMKLTLFLSAGATGPVAVPRGAWLGRAIPFNNGRVNGTYSPH